MLNSEFHKAFYQIIVLTTLFKYMDTKRQCIKGMTTPGYTMPPDDIIIEYGNPLDITCILNEEYQKQNPNVSSKDLYFESGGLIISKEMITILNSTSIHLHIDRPEISTWVYNCKLKNIGGVCLNTVYVGTKPELLDDFSCIGSNYENLTCSWTAPFNPVHTTYSLHYLTGTQNHRHLQNDCPYLQKTNNYQMSCTWTLATHPPYRQTQDEMYFELTATNQFGTARLNKSVSNYKRIVPAPPENLTCTNVTSDSLVLKWSIPNSMQMFPPGVQHRIIYKSEFDEEEWKVAAVLFTTPLNKTKRMAYNLTNLTYAYALYDLGVAIRSAAVDPGDDTMWSTYSLVSFRTKSKVPGRPPSTTTGSFEIIKTGHSLHRTREVYVYWKQVLDKYKNGKNFTYYVEVISNSKLQAVEVTNAYAKYSNLSISEEYIFHIWSSNNIGRSENFSTVVVPRQLKSVEGPAHFTKLIRDEHTYELSWDPPKDVISNYTIFACLYERDRPYQCAGYLNWKVIPPNKISYTVKPPEPKKIYQFAISANSNESSSGMVWAECSIIPSQVGKKLRDVWINKISSTYIVLNWKLDCSERIGGIEGFGVHYCDYEDFPSSCKWSTLHLKGSNVEQANITYLLPYTKYAFLVEKLTKNEEFQHKSDYLFGTTLEAAPTPPTNITQVNVTNSSVTISWEKPITANGKVRHYIIVAGHYIHDVEANTQKFTLKNLTAYTTYNVSVLACTNACSDASLPLSVKTQGGFPSKIDQPGVSFQNDSITLVEWDPPKQPNGDCNFYEILFKERRRYENKTLNIINTTERYYVIKDCGSGGKYNTFFISVRAVNILNGTRYEGSWSEELQSFCRHPSTNAWIWAVGPLLLLAAFLIYLGRRMYDNCKKMRDIEVKMPPGLATLSISTEKFDHQLPVVIEDVPLKDKISESSDLQNFVQEKQIYISMNEPCFNNVVKPANTNKEVNQYVSVYNPETQADSNEIGYVQVGDITCNQVETSCNLHNIESSVTPNMGYVTVGDITALNTSR